MSTISGALAVRPFTAPTLSSVPAPPAPNTSLPTDAVTLSSGTSSPSAQKIHNGKVLGALSMGTLSFLSGVVGGPVGAIAGAAYGGALGTTIAASHHASKGVVALAGLAGGAFFGLIGSVPGGSLLLGLIDGGVGAWIGSKVGGFTAAGGFNYLKG